MDHITGCFGVKSGLLSLLGLGEDPSKESKPKSSLLFPPHVNSLPYELLAPIFNLIPLPERNEIRRICKQWKDIMDTMVGTQTRIGDLSIFDLDYQENSKTYPKCQSYSVISNVGIESLIVGNLTKPPSDLLLGWFRRLRGFFQDQAIEIPKFKNPDLLNSVKFCGQIIPIYFESLVSEMTCIRELKIHVCSLTFLEPQSLQNLDLPNLEHFSIKFGRRIYGLEYGSIKEWNNLNTLNNILTLCSNFFPNLKHAIIESLYATELEKEISLTYLQFLHRHHLTIEKFTLQFCLQIDNQSVQTFEPINVDESDLLKLAESIQKVVQLKRINIFSLCLVGMPYSNVWSSIIKAQKGLEACFMVGVLYKSDFIQKIINFNCKTLRNICISRIALFDNNTFDCGIFATCENIKFLALRGSQTTTMYDGRLTNLLKLPQSLSQLDLGDVGIGIDDTRFLALEMTNLEDLEFRFIGYLGGMGVNLDTLKEVISRKKLRKLGVHRSFNGDFPLEGLYNGNELNPEYFKIVDTSIGFKLGPEGYYTSL